MNRPALSRLRARSTALVAALCALCTGADSQTPQQPPQTVQWRASVADASALRRGQHATLELTGQILEGWHVYGLKQHPRGPTELRFGVDDNSIVQPLGAPAGSDTIRRVDPGFGFEIGYYTQSLKITLPVRVKQRAAPGRQQIPVSVRFQSCSERTCLPPATVHLSVEVDVQPDG
jgi:hypothetical protein